MPGEEELQRQAAEHIRACEEKQAQERRDGEIKEAQFAKERESRKAEEAKASASREAENAWRVNEPMIFFAEGNRVTKKAIYGPYGDRFPLDQVLAVKSSKAFIWGWVVDVFDLVDRSVRYRFNNGQNAVEFIAAIRDTNGSVTIRRDVESIGWFIWW